MSYEPAADPLRPMRIAAAAQRAQAARHLARALANFGDDRPFETTRAILRRAFDLGITHFDLANNYGPPYGSAEETFGRLIAEDFARTATSS